MRSNDRIKIYTVDHQGERTWLPAVYRSIAAAMVEVRRLEQNPDVVAAVASTQWEAVDE